MAKKQTKTPMLNTWQKAAIGILAGGVLGLGGLVVGLSMLEAYQIQLERLEDKDPQVPVVVAARTLYPGVKIAPEDLFVLEVPQSLLDDNMVNDPIQIVGKYPKERILVNEFTRRERLADPDSGEGLNAVLPRGMRAISIEIANGPALSGHLQPGNYVDVVLTYAKGERGGGGGETVTETISQAMFVLAVNARSVEMTPEESRARPARSAPAVTLLTTPEEAKLIAFAEVVGSVRLTLRNDLDQAFSETEGTDLTKLLEDYEAPIKEISAETSSISFGGARPN